jgi:hypothetical protein
MREWEYTGHLAFDNASEYTVICMARDFSTNPALHTWQKNKKRRDELSVKASHEKLSGDEATEYRLLKDSLEQSTRDVVEHKLVFGLPHAGKQR